MSGASETLIIAGLNERKHEVYGLGRGGWVRGLLPRTFGDKVQGTNIQRFCENPRPFEADEVGGCGNSE